MYRRADALFELRDALLTACSIPSPPHLSLARPSTGAALGQSLYALRSVRGARTKEEFIAICLYGAACATGKEKPQESKEEAKTGQAREETLPS